MGKQAKAGRQIAYLLIPHGGLIDKQAYGDWVYFHECRIAVKAVTAAGIVPIRAVLVLARSWEQYALVLTTKEARS